MHADGIFWMSFEDFVYHYDTVYLCRIFQSDDWHTASCPGEWIGDSAAGCGNFDHFNLNPQYRLTLKEKADVVVTLRQSNVLDHSREWSTINMSMLKIKGGK